jgi:hypothetical protein
MTNIRKDSLIKVSDLYGGTYLLRRMHTKQERN